MFFLSVFLASKKFAHFRHSECSEESSPTPVIPTQAGIHFEFKHLQKSQKPLDSVSGTE